MKEEKLSKRVAIRQIIGRTLSFLIIYAGFVVSLVTDKEHYGLATIKWVTVGLLGLLTLLLLVVNFITPLFIYKLSYYNLDEERLLFQHGVVIRKRVFLPIKRIQHVEKSQGPIQILLKTANVSIFTAGSIVMVYDLDIAAADSLVEALRGRLNVVLDQTLGEDSNEH